MSQQLGVSVHNAGGSIAAFLCWLVTGHRTHWVESSFRAHQVISVGDYHELIVALRCYRCGRCARSSEIFDSSEIEPLSTREMDDLLSARRMALEQLLVIQLRRLVA